MGNQQPPKRRKSTHENSPQRFPQQTSSFLETPVNIIDIDKENVLSAPHGVAFEPNHKLIVVSVTNSRCLQCWSLQDKEPEYLFGYGTVGRKNGALGFPEGVCFQPGSNNLIVTDEHRVQVFYVPETRCSSSDPVTHLFTLGACTDKDEHEPGRFNNPRGVCCTARGDIIVADSCNHRMQKFDCKGRYVRAFGSRGDGNNQFQFPHGVCVQEDAEASRMIITDSCNNRLSVWSVDGSQRILTVPVQRDPRGICNDLHSHRIVVSCGNRCDTIKVFDAKTKNEWKVVQHLGSSGSQPGLFNCPYGMCIDDRGVLAVTDLFNHRVQLFQTAARK